jgi:hypothetical protein
MNTTWYTVRRRILNASKKYFNTWVLLLRAPSNFIRLSLEDKAKFCTSPWTFFATSLVVVPAIFQPVLYLAVHSAPVPDQLASSVHAWDIGGSSIYQSGVNVALLAALWYIAFIKLFKVKLAIRTTTPGRRVLYELLYILAGPSQLFCYASIAAALVFVDGFASVVLSPHFTPLQHGTLADFFILLIWISFMTLTFILPNFVIPLRYDVLIATTLLSISRFRAYLLCTVISLIACLIIFATTIWGTLLLPYRLTTLEREAVDCLFSLARLESIYAFPNHHGLPLDRLIDELSFIDLTKGETGGIAAADVRNIQLLKAGKLDRYVFTVHLGTLSYVEAVPRSYGGDTKYSFLAVYTPDPGSLLSGFGGDHRGGIAKLSDPKLLPPPILHYK